MASETTPLVSKNGLDPPSNAVGSSPTYFLDNVQRRKPSSAGEDSFHTAVSRESEEVDGIPEGADAAEFSSRPVLGRNAPPPGIKNRRMRTASIGGGWLDYVADSWKPKSAPFASTSGDREGTAINTGGIGTLLLPRRVPLKVEPKVYLANERTFLAWLHVCLMLAGASLTIVTFSRDETIVNQLYGIVLLPVSVAYMFYALWQYLKRSLMIKHREPGPFIDIVGPTTLTVILMATIITQFCLKLHSMMYDV
mmetsp:Transcript_10914/g.19892  ORF Transcript_10914/g.19892 Transcript_10914/m.19892 type:complete len:252 (+) Transcript_10914:56-811(+)|eukprot:CAMPEP_0201879986 /NCGR_PEP_ID=MMETSP0902-20130614/10718_1 /ASSEMBLY_ACC=CAM_ASM_000551 /TAXON_ID=420261 /ORGANISM="Thalassiosira antarctica, Strain CCMP982" /LENGTH=251 /DNA_ID=CAMNT_0048407939 /DNA_START=34 /DNA_END=789 /DNA_ORIENTATION=-